QLAGDFQSEHAASGRSLLRRPSRGDGDGRLVRSAAPHARTTHGGLICSGTGVWARPRPLRMFFGGMLLRKRNPSFLGRDVYRPAGKPGERDATGKAPGTHAVDRSGGGVPQLPGAHVAARPQEVRWADLRQFYGAVR